MTNSHILVHPFNYLEPSTLAEAVELLARHADRARLLAGGTDLLVQMKLETRRPDYVIGLRAVPGLDGIQASDGGLHIGARTPIRPLALDARLRLDYTALAEACAAFSTTQVQVMGTLGGNLCNGSPASDTAPALLALDAQLVVLGPRGERRLPVEEFFLGPGQTALQPDELLTAVLLPRAQAGRGSAFMKVSRVMADLAKVNAAVALVRQGERIVDCRLAFGAVARRPIRARQAEALLRGQTFSADLMTEAAALAAGEVTPIDDVRSTAWYRRQAVQVMTADALNLAWQRAAGARLSAGQQSSGSNGSYVHPLSRVARPVLPAAQAVAGSTCHDIELMVNGSRHRLTVASNELLLNVLRERLELTGTKYACGIGECGACTVQLNGAPVLACLVLAASAHGSHILTVEGLQAPDGTLDPLQEAFLDQGAVQCGFCTPGMLMTSKSLLQEKSSITEDDVRDYLKGNLCRCTGYASIVRAVLSCAGNGKQHS